MPLKNLALSAALGLFIVLVLTYFAALWLQEHHGSARSDNPVLAKAAELRKDFDDIHIYVVSNRYEVWCTGVGPGQYKDAATLDEAHKIINNYYIEWAKRCIGDMPTGKLVE